MDDPQASIPEIESPRVAWENLPLPFVFYSRFGGVLLAFGETEKDTPYICECARTVVENYLALRRWSPQFLESDAGNLREVPLDDNYFPEIIARASLNSADDPIRGLKFRPRLCHRCNMATPTRIYDAYGSPFRRSYGWYIEQAALRAGVSLFSLSWPDCRPDVCPPELAEKVKTLRQLARAQTVFFYDVEAPNPFRDRAKYSFDEVQKRYEKLKREVWNLFENEARQEFGIKKIGDAWVSETILYRIICHMFPEKEVLRHHRPDWLGGLELDVYIPALDLGFEYQGQQHFHPVEAWGGESALQETKKRDARKAAICKERGTRLVTIDYTEPLTESHVRSLFSAVEP